MFFSSRSLVEMAEAADCVLYDAYARACSSSSSTGKVELLNDAIVLRKGEGLGEDSLRVLTLLARERVLGSLGGSTNRWRRFLDDEVAALSTEASTSPELLKKLFATIHGTLPIVDVDVALVGVAVAEAAALSARVLQQLLPLHLAADVPSNEPP